MPAFPCCQGAPWVQEEMVPRAELLPLAPAGSCILTSTSVPFQCLGAMGTAALRAHSTIYDKAQIKGMRKNGVRPSVTQGEAGDKEHRHKPHQTQQEKQQPWDRKGRLMEVCALVPSEATS